MFKLLINKYYLPVAVLLIAIVGTLNLMFLLRPSLEAFRIARLQSSDANEQYESIISRLKATQLLNEQLNTIAPREITKLQSIFLNKPELAYLLEVMRKNAQATRFLLTALSIAEVEEPTGGAVKEVAVQAQLEGGGYRELKEFLRLITTGVPLLEISSFTYDPNGAMLALNLRAYVSTQLDGGLKPIDANFFNDSKFKALSDSVPLPNKGLVGRENPFAPVE